MSQTTSDYTSPRLPVFQHAILKNIGRPGYEAIIWHYHYLIMRLIRAEQERSENRVHILVHRTTYPCMHVRTYVCCHTSGM